MSSDQRILTEVLLESFQNCYNFISAHFVFSNYLNLHYILIL